MYYDVPLPWAGERSPGHPSADLPISARLYTLDNTTGNVCTIYQEFEIKYEDNVAKGYRELMDKRKSGIAPTMTSEEVEKVYSLSKKRGISLADAYVEVKGKRSLTPEWVDRLATAPKYYACSQEEVAKEPVKVGK